MQDPDEENVIDMNNYALQQDEDAEASAIDMKEYASSPEAEEATWWDVAKDTFVQPILGTLNAFTIPADVLKIGMMAEGLSGVDELEEAYKKAGKEFDKNDYIKKVAETSQYIPLCQYLFVKLLPALN